MNLVQLERIKTELKHGFYEINKIAGAYSGLTQDLRDKILARHKEQCSRKD
jgi:hypothetical protein